MARTKREATQASSPAVRKTIAALFITLLAAALVLALFQRISWVVFWIVAALAYLVSIALKKHWL
jgi:fatty acid desaturase